VKNRTPWRCALERALPRPLIAGFEPGFFVEYLT
jgi:hypothetical protein